MSNITKFKKKSPKDAIDTRTSVLGTFTFLLMMVTVWFVGLKTDERINPQDHVSRQIDMIDDATEEVDLEHVAPYARLDLIDEDEAGEEEELIEEDNIQ